MQKSVRRFTRKDLEEEFSISRWTVTRSLKCAGLHTRGFYSEEEVMIFRIVRSLFRRGYTQKEIKREINGFLGIRSTEKEIHTVQKQFRGYTP